MAEAAFPTLASNQDGYYKTGAATRTANEHNRFGKELPSVDRCFSLVFAQGLSENHRICVCVERLAAFGYTAGRWCLTMFTAVTMSPMAARASLQLL